MHCRYVPKVLTLFLKGNCCLKRQEVNGYEDVIDCMFRKLKQRKTSKWKQISQCCSTTHLAFLSSALLLTIDRLDEDKRLQQHLPASNIDSIWSSFSVKTIHSAAVKVSNSIPIYKWETFFVRHRREKKQFYFFSYKSSVSCTTFVSSAVESTLGAHWPQSGSTQGLTQWCGAVPVPVGKLKLVLLRLAAAAAWW